MSKCPLQLYLNDKYLESSPSVQTSNNVFKKTFKKCRENGLLNTQKYQGNGFFENDKCKVLDKPNGHKNRTVLDEYLAEHSKSIAAYHNLQKQQEEVLNLCKQKIAKRFPSSVRAVLKDEDIINALRIAENSDCHVVESKKSGDRLVHAVLNAIMSNVHHHLNPQNSDCNSNQTYQKEDKQLRGVSPSDFLNPKKKSVFSKFVRFFGKSNNQKAYLTSSDNYFNNSKYTIDSNPMGVVPYTGKTNEQNDNSSNHGDKKQTFKYMLNKFAGDSWHASKSMQSDTSTNLSEAINQTFGKRNKQYLTYYCTYQRDVDLLKSEIQKQKSEIKSIQKNLNRCLNILKAFEEKGNKGNKNDMFNTNTTAYHVLTPNEYRGYHNPAEPYSRYYPHYRAELETTYDGQGSTSNYRSNSSNDAQKKKCCSSKKKGKKKKGKKKKDKYKSKEEASVEVQTPLEPPVKRCKCKRRNECLVNKLPEEPLNVVYTERKHDVRMNKCCIPAAYPIHSLPPESKRDEGLYKSFPSATQYMDILPPETKYDEDVYKSFTSATQHMDNLPPETKYDEGVSKSFTPATQHIHNLPPGDEDVNKSFTSATQYIHDLPPEGYSTEKCICKNKRKEAKTALPAKKEPKRRSCCVRFCKYLFCKRCMCM